MGIEGINTAMTPLQFTQARSATRTVETTEHSSSGGGGAAITGRSLPASAASATRSQAGRLLLPVSDALHFTYRPVPGKRAAKRHPQIADSSYWSRALNHLG